MKIFLLAIILVLSVFVVFGRALTPKTHVRFTNRTEASLTLAIDGVEICTADSMNACEGVVSYGPHKLSAMFRGREIIFRNSPAKTYVNFAVCHKEDTTPICKPIPKG